MQCIKPLYKHLCFLGNLPNLKSKKLQTKTKLKTQNKIRNHFKKHYKTIEKFIVLRFKIP